MKLPHLLLGFFLVFINLVGFSQEIDEKHTVIIIKTSIHNEGCEERVITAMLKKRGINKVAFNVDTDSFTIEYNAVKISDEELREMISEFGFSADDIDANEDAYEALPEECK